MGSKKVGHIRNHLVHQHVRRKERPKWQRNPKKIINHTYRQKKIPKVTADIPAQDDRYSQKQLQPWPTVDVKFLESDDQLAYKNNLHMQQM